MNHKRIRGRRSGSERPLVQMTIPSEMTKGRDRRDGRPDVLLGDVAEDAAEQEQVDREPVAVHGWLGGVAAPDVDGFEAGVHGALLAR